MCAECRGDVQVGEAQCLRRFFGFYGACWCGVMDAQESPASASYVPDQVEGDGAAGFCVR